jgi:hypothetical protein
MLDEQLRPSAEAERSLRAAGWSPERIVDIGEWVKALREDGNTVFPRAESILESFGGLLIRARTYGGLRQSFDVDPSHWVGMRDIISDTEEVLGCHVFPLGQLSGDAMLAVLDDGRIISEFQGYVDLLGENWSSALDHLTLGKGGVLPLAEDYVPLDQRPE